MNSRPVSEEIFRSLCEAIPGGVNSPVRAGKSVAQLPMIIDRAKEDLLIDVDGHSYIDFCGSWGALIHGHAHPVILEAVYRRMQKGTSFGIATALEGELAGRIISLVESIEKVRFVSSGTEATMSAARLARGFTGRDSIVKFGGNYHGHADLFLVEAGSGVLETSLSASSDGIPEDSVKHTICLPFNDIEACHALFSDETRSGRIAAVILEPVAGNMGVVPADPEFVRFLREKTTAIGALLIFDEVMTGFRVALNGAQSVYSVKPDLTCFGKIIGGGFPAAAFGGRKEIMDCLAPGGSVYQAGTLSGNPPAMEAGLQSLRLLDTPGFYEELQRKTDLLLNPIKARIAEKGINACVQESGSMFTVFFGKRSVKNLEEARKCDSALFARFFRTLFARGIYIPPSQYEAWFISAAHRDEHLERTADAVLSFFDELESETPNFDMIDGNTS